MAVTQISQVQVRRGLMQDLGQLTSGEFGWAVDELRLFIGNGPVVEGAPYEGITEVVTLKSLQNFYSGGGSGLTGLLSFPYTFKGSDGGYDVQTDIVVTPPHSRPLQKKLDDTVNVKDFNAQGNGITDDYAAIQRAIDQIYNRKTSTIPSATRRVIEFAPGIYNIENELTIPPYCVLRAGGRGSVTIRQISTAATCIFRLSNSLGNYDASLVNGVVPGQVEMQGIRFEITSSINRVIGIVESATNVLFDRCQFVGSRSFPTTDTNTHCLLINSNYRESGGIKFVNCDFSGMDTAVTIQDNYQLNGIIFDSCSFYNCLKGIVARTNRSRSYMGLKVINSAFNKIKEQALLTLTNVTGVSSTTNTYLDVGTNYSLTNVNVSTVAITAVATSVIKFGGDNSYSFGDMFLRPFDKEFDVPTVEHASSEVISIDTSSGLKLGSRYQTIGKSYLLPGGNNNYIPIPAKLLGGTIHYTIERLQRFRSGVITYTVDTLGNIVCFRDSYTQVSSTDVIIEMYYTPMAGLGTNPRPVINVKTVNVAYGQTVFTFDIKSQDFKTLTDSSVQIPNLSFIL
jgi:hypothetical protein